MSGEAAAEPPYITSRALPARESGEAARDFNWTLQQSSHGVALAFTASLPKQKQSRAKSRQLRRLSSIRSVIIRVLTKANDHEAGVRFVYHDEYDYRPKSYYQ